jgi:predicted nucleic acid-binding protein
MPKAGSKTYYWDTSSFIAWLDGGVGHSKDVIDGLDAIAKEVNENRATLCTSVMTETEVDQGKLTPEQATKFQNLFKRRNVISIGIDSKIARMASEIRNHYNAKKIKISTPDSIHLATAIIYGVNEFHTLDGDGKRRRPSDLLRLNGNVAGHSLHIRVPIAIQPSLFGGVRPVPLDVESAGGKVEKETKQIESSAPQIQGRSARSTDSQTAEAKTEGQNQEGDQNLGKKEGPPSL